MFDDFSAFVRAVVLPGRAAHPDHVRLDGRTAGGNWDVAGTFRHNGEAWRVHADSHYEALLIAYEGAATGADPFIETATKRGRCLALTPELRARRQSRHKHLYIYALDNPTGGPNRE